jgi:hypothetical protein
MTTLYDAILPKIQDDNSLGGGSFVFQFRKDVFDAVDQGADGGDQTLIALRSDIRKRLREWQKPEDYTARSQFFGTYSEAVFYLVTSKRGVPIESIPRSNTKTPDFRTKNGLPAQFEVKTVDIASPETSYPEFMHAGLDTQVMAEEEARRRGVGFGTQEIKLHGAARSWFDVISQVMSKLDGNIKRGQYEGAPTFLVADMSRTSVRIDPSELAHKIHVSAEETFEGDSAWVSGQLWTIANHEVNTNFVWQDMDRRIKLESLHRSGILRSHRYVQGIIFTTDPWSKFSQAADWRDSYSFLGVWNDHSEGHSCDEVRNARRVFDQICSFCV